MFFTCKYIKCAIKINFMRLILNPVAILHQVSKIMKKLNGNEKYKILNKSDGERSKYKSFSIQLLAHVRG